MVAQIPQEYSGIDFGSFITEKTEAFIGRRWVFDEIHDWLSQPNEPRFLLLNGKPGSGKTAIAARLCQFSDANAVAPADLSLFHTQHFLSAYHFCSARDGNWIDPRSFVWSVALQLARRYEEFAKALINAGDAPVDIRGEAIADLVENSVVAGVIIKNLSLSGMSSQEAFNRFLIGPLQNIYNQGFSKPITILVDSLDESLNHRGNITIANLLSRVKHLSSKVRFIVTSRDDDRVTIDFLEDATLVALSESKHKENNDRDIADLVHLQISQVSDLKQKTDGLSATDLERLVTTIVNQAEGNFLYVAFLLSSLALPHHPLSDLDTLPPGLDGLYYDSIKRVVSLGTGTWKTNYSPLMGVLSVAQSPLTIDQIEQSTEQASSDVWSGVNDLQQFIAKSDTGSNASVVNLVYRLYHQSVIDFLHKPYLEIKSTVIGNTYLLHSLDWHSRIVNRYVNQPDWEQWDDYGIRYFATHLAEAANLSKGAQQQQHLQDLVKFVSNRAFWQLHKRRVNDLALLQRDLDRTLRAAASNSDRKGLLSLIKAGIAVTSFRRQELRPNPLFELARQGNVAGAKSRLDLFDVDADWKLIALLIIAWLAVETDQQEARRLRNQLKDSTHYTPIVGLLISRLDAELDNTAVSLTSLPTAPDERAAQELVSALGGKAVDIELLTAHRGKAQRGVVQPGAELIGGLDAPKFLAETDAQLLVAYAEANKPNGDKYFKQYIAIHTSYNYVEYRNKSLLHVLDAALRSSDNHWVKEMATSMAVAALAGNAVEFQEGMLITLLGMRGISNSSLLEAQRQRLIAESNELKPERGEGDSWGFYRRSLGSLAQVYAVLLNDVNTAIDLVEHALKLPYGFAGFNAPASVFLAEATQVCQPGNNALIKRCLEAALNSAHNIQEVIFCVRSTARVNAMRQRWWGLESLEIGDLIRRLTTEPSAAEFSALHVIGEQYDRREPPPRSAELPWEFRHAQSLSQLAEVYRRPLSEFLRLNKKRAADEPLPFGTEVNVPDPGFATQLAARLAAEVLQDSNLSSAQGVGLIQQLVPLASLSPTALDTVCARLVLANKTLDIDTLNEIERLAVDTLIEGQSKDNTENYRVFYPVP